VGLFGRCSKGIIMNNRLDREFPGVSPQAALARLGCLCCCAVSLTGIGCTDGAAMLDAPDPTSASERAADQAIDQATEKPRLAVYFASRDESAFASSTPMYIEWARETVYRSNEPTITDEHVATVRFHPKSWRAPNEPSTLAIDLTDEGKALMRSETERFIDNYVIVTWDGDVFSNPRIFSRFSGIPITEKENLKITPDKLRSIERHFEPVKR
jgi:hypothetical protein